MLVNVVLAALVASPLVAAHGKIAVITGDQGGNTTALGIQGGIVPGPGKNKVTEVDTTVFKSTNAMTDGLGKTTGQGANTLDMMTQVMAQSGSTLPQVASDGTGAISGTVHVVTSDGFGPYTAVLDTTGTGAFSTGTKMTVTTQVDGNKGNTPKRSLFMRALENMNIIEKRATNVNQDFPIAATVPAGTTCQGSVGGQTGVCLVKLVNPSNAGPFGGVIAIQMAGTAGAAAPAAAPAASTGSTTATTGATGATKATKAGKTTRELVGAKFRA